MRIYKYLGILLSTLGIPLEIFSKQKEEIPGELMTTTNPYWNSECYQYLLGSNGKEYLIIFTENSRF